MQWFYNVLSWHFACLALALLVLGITPLAGRVMANSPPATTQLSGGNGGGEWLLLPRHTGSPNCLLWVLVRLWPFVQRRMHRVL